MSKIGVKRKVNGLTELRRKCLKIYEILMGYSGECPQKQPSTGNLQNKSSEKNWQNSQENNCARVSIVSLLVLFFKRETPVEVISCEFFKIFDNTFF